jgi:flagellar basal body rod protein FlgF
MLQGVISVVTLAVMIGGILTGVWHWATGGFTRQLYDAVVAFPDVDDKLDQVCRTQAEIERRQNDFSELIRLLIITRRYEDVELNEDELLNDLEADGWDKYIRFGDGRRDARNGDDD